jgi:type I restriction enzyme M protein
MLTDPTLRSKVDQLWDRLWTGGLSNPLDAIEQFSYLLFLKRLDEAEDNRERQTIRRGLSYTSPFPSEMRWKTWTKYGAAEMLEHLRGKVFPWFRQLSGDTESSFAKYMGNAELKINKPTLLVQAVNLIDEMKISAQNRDVQGDLYEYLLSHLQTAGRNGQFRTPRHIIRMMVEMISPRPRERIGDLAAGTAGFLVNAYEYILEKHTSEGILSYDEEEIAHGAVGDLLSEEEMRHLQGPKGLRGYDNDSGMTMLRIGSMNLMLHGVSNPRFEYADTLSKSFRDTSDYDVLLMNPPFKGAVDKGDVSDTLPGTTTKTELLFLHLMLRALDMGGRAAVIVPDGVLFGSSKAHIDTRKKLIEENRLEAVVSMPSGVFKPYAGVSTAVLIFTKGAKTERIWFYDMQHDGFSLDDKRQKVRENDIPDLLECWQNRFSPEFGEARRARLETLRAQLAPLKAERLRMQADINRLTFESVIAPDGEETAKARAALEADQQKLAEIDAQIAPLQAQFNRLSRQFWVTKEQVKANKYDLSASRYRQVEQDEGYYEKPQVTMERLLRLEQIMTSEIDALKRMVA